MITHQEQQAIWEREHQNPLVLLQMDAKHASSGVVPFWQWLQQHGATLPLQGIEMGCGKGRNALWLAGQGVAMTGFDFSAAAIAEATHRKQEQECGDLAQFVVHDATLPWPWKVDTFNFGIDCFASTDIETPQGRQAAVQELHRVLKPGGYVLAYLLSTDDEFHKEMIMQFPTQEVNTFLHPTTGKFEKAFDREEVLSLYQGFQLVEERRMNKKTMFFNTEYSCSHLWMVFKKI